MESSEAGVLFHQSADILRTNHDVSSGS